MTMVIVAVCLICVAIFMILAWACLVIAGRADRRADMWMGQERDMMNPYEDESEGEKQQIPPQTVHVTIVRKGKDGDGGDKQETDS